MTDGSWRVLIVDDEPLAREGIRARLEAAGGFTVMAEVGNGHAAVSAIRAQRPDVVFLDVQMPGLDGLQVVEEIGADHMPFVVFVTAFDRYALAAFDTEAVDYVLKPIDDDRFGRTLRRVRERLTEARDGSVGRRISAVVAELGRAGHETAVRAQGRDQLLLRDGNRTLVMRPAEVDWIEADGDYVRVHAGARRVMVRETMTSLEHTLDPTIFTRIHRSAIVNVTRIQELQAQPNNDYVVVLRSGVRLRASRSYSPRLKELFGST